MNRYLTYQGQTKTLTEWAREFGISRAVLWQRLHLGWSVEKALTTPVVRRSPPTKIYSRLTYRGQTKSLSEWGEEFGIRPNIIRKRLCLGWSIKKALTTPVKAGRPIRYRLRYRGQTKSLVEWAEEFGLAAENLRNRLRLGWTMEAALTTPVRFNLRRRRLHASAKPRSDG